MHRRRLLTLSSALLAGAFAGCATEETPPDDTPSPPGTPPDVSDDALMELVTGTNELAFNLYSELISERSGENLLASPVSITTALAMAYAGARDETRTQMRETLQYTLDDARLHDTFQALQHTLNDRGAAIPADEFPSNYESENNPVPFQLNLVNAVWGQVDYAFREEYLSVLEDHYRGGFQEVDYKSDPAAARAEINKWVADQTSDRIQDLLPEGSLTILTRLVLTNAIYFLANWQSPFNVNATNDESFELLNESTTTVQMMTQQSTFLYATVDGAKAVDLPYLGQDVSMLVILPPSGEFTSYEATFNVTRLTRIVSSLEARDGRVSIPRFEFDSGFALKDAFIALGMPVAFDPRNADFSGIADMQETNENLYIDDIYHDTYIAVDETGTEAAAATGVVISTESAPLDPFSFVADRPFLFVIRDRPTDTVLFLGRVMDPS